MTGSYRKLGLWLAAAMLTAPAALAQDLKATFNQAVDLLQRDRKAEALVKFQAVLAMSPSADQAFELWNETPESVWLEIRREQGDFELVAKRIGDLVTSARKARANDAEAIQKLITDLRVDDPIARGAAIRQLSANHGEFAVPHLLGWLSDTGNEQHCITAIQALSEMNTDVVVPLCEALASDNAFLRRNIAMVLKKVGDPRSAGALASMAKGDTDGACRTVAGEALTKVKSSGDACRDFCTMGEDYHMRRDTVLADYQWSDVVWNWADGKLVATETPHALYGDEMAKKAFRNALKNDGSCADAHAGLARAYAGQLASSEALAGAGTDVTAWAEKLGGNHLMLGFIGPAALDAALAKSIAQGDSGTAVVLVRALSEGSPAPTAAMGAALNAADGSIRAEAAVALGNMSTWGKCKASGAVINALGMVASREVVRLAFVIDGNAARSAQVSDALRAAGMHVNTASNGVLGLSMLRRMPGLDLVVIADSLVDVTTHQVIDEIKTEPAFAKAPVFILSDAPDGVAEAFGDKATGALANPSDVSAVSAAMAGSMGAERDRADVLAGQAAALLAQLAGNGSDISSTVEALGGALGRIDSVATPAAYALCSAGGANQVAALTAVVSDSARSEGVREAAGHALASIFGRGVASGDAAKALMDVAHSDAPLSVRKAAAQALGNIQMSAADRGAHLAH